jgi:nucleotide-binding universal stress UspA family protein
MLDSQVDIVETSGLNDKQKKVHWIIAPGGAIVVSHGAEVLRRPRARSPGGKEGVMKKILVAIDFSDVSEEAIRAGGEMARAFNGPLRLIHVVESEPAFVGYEAGPAAEREIAAKRIQKTREEMAGLRDRLRGEGLTVDAVVRHGPTIEKIVEEIERFEANLLVIGSHGHGALYHLLLGSVSGGVVRRAPCPTLLVPSRPGAKAEEESP